MRPTDNQTLASWRPVWLWTVAVFAVLATLDGARLALWTYGADTGTFAQVVGDAFGGMRNGIEHGTHYRYPWSPVLALLWPLVAFSHSALPLQLLQTAATVGSAPLLYALTVRRVGTSLGLRIAVISLIYPPLVAIGWGEFHEIGLFTPLVIGMVLAAN